MRLPESFYQRNDVCTIARELLGKTVVTLFDGRMCRARITETEAYNGRTDRACHAFLNRRTQRTEVMYMPGGTAYVYLCYGIHHLFNVVTNREGLADAVLVRAAQPLEGLETMLVRRDMESYEPRLMAGPGSFSKALGITTELHGHRLLTSDCLWIEDAPPVSDNAVNTGKRIGIDYAGEDANLPWRYFLKK